MDSLSNLQGFKHKLNSFSGWNEQSAEYAPFITFPSIKFFHAKNFKKIPVFDGHLQNIFGRVRKSKLKSFDICLSMIFPC